MQTQGTVVMQGVDWHQWSEDKQTQEFLLWLHQSAASHQAAWLAGEYTSHEANIAAQAVAQAFERIAFEIGNIEIGTSDDS